jgi:hypothetical protein
MSKHSALQLAVDKTRLFGPIKNKEYSIVILSKPAVETTQSLIQWVYVFFPRSTVAGA